MRGLPATTPWRKTTGSYASHIPHECLRRWAVRTRK
nr:MAG TPA: hypothetical protein [Caudoviricetes sp.]